ncbi:carbohydrate-binding family 9-like protein [Chitinophaga nivalis]|uniref:Carbohydrate-binding family 9-like protein n=1 Tax=Chitinophaga nivalis TaxID=2991709 RepID=A0ABT3IUN5_9BACT|nr:carbohydrate-binding family 9-like protein [Chitinophaga nivalis]MCW3462610.1 carbohydrate-binding family 9-like protein [Chitinophaga nivalis]MCW3487699.1 carbohydrate-binding family 9-like protein [Chitinophaga nivalis]
MIRSQTFFKGFICLAFSTFLFAGTDTYAQTFSESFRPFRDTPRHYVCYQTADSMQIDGQLTEAAWQKTNWSEDFKDIEGDSKPAPALRTRVKMLWDQHYLYIAATLQEPHIWGTLREHDTIIFQDNDFEVFIDPDGDTHQYYEIEINALNTVMDLFMGKPYRNGGAAMLNWDTKGIRTAVHVNGTLNNPTDTDQEWTVEMAIPFSALRFFTDDTRPADNSIWRINFSRVEWDTHIRNGRYVKKQQPEHNWVWSPQGIINMHAPERWGYLQFSEKPAGSNTVVFQVPAAAAAQQHLWQIYHAQQQYRRQHGRYAGNLQLLQMTAKQNGTNGEVYTLETEGTSSQFNARIKSNRQPGVWYINHEGKIYSDRK